MESTMKIEFIDKAKNGVIGVVLFEGTEAKISKTYCIRQTSDFKAKANACQVAAIDGDKTIIFAGLGKEAEYSNEILKKAVGKFVACAGQYKAKELTIDCTAVDDVASVVEGTVLAGYSFLKYKPTDEKEKTTLEKLSLITSKPKNTSEKEAGHALLVANTVNYVRDLSNEPANVATPTFLAKAGQQVATTSKNIACTVLDKKKLEELGCNSLLSVAAGSTQPPAMVILDYKPAKYSKTIAFVGKGITFDSGGISLKPGKDMDQMKFDKNGACAVIGSVKAISELQLPIRVVGVFAATENLPSGSASKPGDVVKAYNGKTIEILNTDAEGRLVLADALAYTVANYKPDYVVDIATLTGACVVALGNSFSGLTTNNDKFAESVLEAGIQSGDRCWKLPLGTDFDDKIKSDVADIKNLGAPEGAGGALTAAAFLKHFVGNTPWVHLDVAGTAWTTSQRDYFVKGATGVGVRLFVKLCENLVKT